MTGTGSEETVAKRGGLVVLSGPSGAGKTSICRRLAEYGDITISVSATTRSRRPGEVDGMDYFFLSRKDFEDRIGKGEFVEYNEVFGNNVLYGSLREELEKGLADPEKYYLMEIDVKGALDVKKTEDYDGVYLFVAPPSMEELRRRLMDRGTDNPASIEGRLKKAEWELEQKQHYDLVVTNDDLEEAVARITRFLELE